MRCRDNTSNLASKDTTVNHQTKNRYKTNKKNVNATLKERKKRLLLKYISALLLI